MELNINLYAICYVYVINTLYSPEELIFPLFTAFRAHIVPGKIFYCALASVVVVVLDKETFVIKELPTYVIIPLDITMKPIDALQNFKIKELNRLPEIKPILKALIPIIRDIFCL